jgi:hypothetical protein
MRRLLVAAVVVICVGAAGPARADDKGDPTGTWKWVVHRGGKERVVVVELKLEGDRVTGVMHGHADMNVEKGTFKDGRVYFEVPADNPDGTHMVHRYSGKLEGDKLTGTAEIEFIGQGKKSGKWEAKRSRD